MNSLYPRAEFDSDQKAVDGFKDLIAEGFENPTRTNGIIRVLVPGHKQLNFTVNLAQTVEYSYDESDGQYDTEITIPIETIHRIFNEFEYLDWRDPSIIGTIRFCGDLNLANWLAKSCLRPTDATVTEFEKVGSIHKKKRYKELATVRYLDNPSQLDILEAIDESTPAVARNLKFQNANKIWDVNKLSDEFGDCVVRVRSADQKQTLREFAQEIAEFEKCPSSHLIEGFTKPYTEGAPLPKEMYQEFGPLFFGTGDFQPPQLWFGSVPTSVPSSSLHRDPLDGFLYQVIGRKRLDLYSADQSSYLYPLKAYNNYQPCWFKPDDPKYNFFPKAKKANFLTVTLNPGELLIQPRGWFHQVYTVDSPNMSVSYFTSQ